LAQRKRREKTGDRGEEKAKYAADRKKRRCDEHGREHKFHQGKNEVGKGGARRGGQIRKIPAWKGRESRTEPTKHKESAIWREGGRRSAISMAIGRMQHRRPRKRRRKYRPMYEGRVKGGRVQKENPEKGMVGGAVRKGSGGPMRPAKHEKRGRRLKKRRRWKKLELGLF